MPSAVPPNVELLDLDMTGPTNKAFASPNFAFLTKHDEVLMRHAAFAEHYVFDDQNSALQTILARQPWATPQRQWLERIGKQPEQDVVVDREAIDSG